MSRRGDRRRQGASLPSPLAALLAFFFAFALAGTAGAAVQWYEHYQRGLELAEAGRFEAALEAFDAAAALQPKPQPRLPTYGRNYVFDYDPHYHRARCLAELGRRGPALAALELSERAGVTRKGRLEELRRRIAELAEEPAESTPPAPKPTSPAVSEPEPTTSMEEAAVEPPGPTEDRAVEPKTIEAKKVEVQPPELREDESRKPQNEKDEAKKVEVKTVEVKQNQAPPASGRPPESHPAETRPAETRTAETRTAETRTDETRTAETRTAEDRKEPVGADPPPGGAGEPGEGVDAAGRASEPPPAAAGPAIPPAGGEAGAGAGSGKIPPWGWTVFLALLVAGGAGGWLLHARRGPAAGAGAGDTAATVAGAASPAVPTSAPSLGGYRILGVLGRGGMATTYRGERLRDDTPVALKVPHEGLTDPRWAARFVREGKLGEQLHHPCIVRILDAGESGGRPFMAMELLPGRTLRHELDAEGRLPLERTLRIVRDLAEALDYAHAKGVIHRDLKPDNVMCLPDGRIKVMDFGIARLAGQAGLTVTQSFLGTPAYAAPEMLAGSAGTDHRIDLYAVGILFYEMLQGRSPFQADTPLELLGKHLHEPLPELADLPHPVPPAVWSVVTRLCAKSPDDRYPTAEALLVELQALLRDLPAGGVAEEPSPEFGDAPTVALDRG